MEKDALRRHVYDEIHSQFETKLREAKRQKTQVEEELESLSEKWRSERRRLNAEIDRLESSLADAKDIRKKGPGKNGRVTESEEVLKAQQAGEEKFKKAIQDWEKEKSALQAEVKRLELGLAEVLERSNNPMRSAQAVRDSLEAKLEDALKGKRRIEDDYATAKAKWEREKEKLEADATKLRRTSFSSKGRSAEEDDELQKKLREAVETRKAIEQEAAEERRRHSVELAALQKELKQTRDLVGEARLQAERATDESRLLRSVHTEQESRMSSAVGQARAESEASQKRLAEELEQTREQLRSLQKEHANELASLKTDVKESSGQGVPAQMQEVMRHRNFLQQQLHQAEETLRVVRAEQSEEFAQLTAQLQEARGEAARVRKNMERELQKARDDASASGQQSIKAGSDPQSKAELQELRRQNDELKRELHDAKEALSKLEQGHATQRDQLSSQLETLRTKAEQAAARHKEEINKATAELEKLRQKQAAGSGKPGVADGGKVEEGVAYQLREVMQQRNYLQQQVHQAEEAVRAMRAEHAAEKKTFMEQLEQARSDAESLDAGDNKETDSEALEQLRKQYDERIQDITQQKARLAEELKQATAMLDAEKKRVPVAAAATVGGAKSVSGADTRRIQEEVGRVEGVIRGITTLIDDPAAELSTVIRKNVERAEWDAYLKGILFSVGKGNGK